MKKNTKNLLIRFTLQAMPRLEKCSLFKRPAKSYNMKEFK